jgi:hypothetical protein
MLRGFFMVCVALALALSAGALAADYPRVFRTFMPEAGPSAFAVELSPELALCYDPLRGGINQLWLGSIDLEPTSRAKINEPAAIRGEVFYQETVEQPWRLNAGEALPKRRFKGYRYVKEAVVFEFTLDGVRVTETLRALAGGRELERTVSVEPGQVLHFQTEPQTKARVTPAQPEPAATVTFTIAPRSR